MQVVQVLPISGIAHSTQDGKYVVVVDDAQHKLHIYEVG